MAFAMLNKFFDKFVFVNQLKFKDYNFSIVDVPFVIVPTDLLASLSLLDNVEFEKKLYYSVKDSFEKQLAPRLRLDFGLEQERFLKFSEVFFTASGFGLLQNIQVDAENKRAIVSVSSSPVAKLLKGKAKRACDHFLRGVLAGIFSSAFKTDVECVERKCLALHEGSCEFVCEPAGKIDFKTKEAQDQLELKL